MGKKEIEEEGARYDISTEWDEEKEAIRVNLKIDASSWQKPTDIDVRLEEHGYPFCIRASILLGAEEDWGSSGYVDYSYAKLTVKALSEDGRELYVEKIDASGRFHHDITFYLDPKSKTTQFVYYRNKDKMVHLTEPPEIWTPDGLIRGPEYVSRWQMAGLGSGALRADIADFISEAAKRQQRLLTSGEWYQIWAKSEKEKLGINMCPKGVSPPPTEVTATWIYFRKEMRNYYDGLVLQFPEVDDKKGRVHQVHILDERLLEEPDIVRDQKGIPKAKNIWEMPLPKDIPKRVKELPKELDTFIDTIFGVEDARRQYSDYVFRIDFRIDPPHERISPEDLRIVVIEGHDGTPALRSNSPMKRGVHIFSQKWMAHTAKVLE